jgi:hypothetical protein
LNEPHLRFKGNLNLSSPSFDLSTFVSQLGRFFLRLSFWLVAAVAVVSLLVVSLGLLMLGLLRALITGQRPAPMTRFRFQNFAAGQRPRFWPRGNSGDFAEGSGVPPASDPLNTPRGPRGRLGADNGAVVDVEAREIRDRPHV